MEEVSNLIQALSQSKASTFWQGPATESSILAVEGKLSKKLPESLRQFLKLCGGGGVEGSEISGIESNNPELDHKGTLWGDTIRCRETWNLPEDLVVIYFKEDEICWCLDYPVDEEGTEPPVVSYSLPLKEKDSLIAPSFLEFFRQYADEHRSRI